MRYCIVIVWLLFSCSQPKEIAGTITSQSRLVIDNMAYGKDSLQQMDVSLVAGRDETTPLVILVHGGGWGSGDKTAANFMRDQLNACHINVVNINYRLANGSTITYKDIMQDIDDAISSVLAKTREWGIRSKKIVLWGGSAGGHLVLLYAYNYDKRKLISTAITLGAPTRLDDRHSISLSKDSNPSVLSLITGKAWTTDSLPVEYQLASPFYGIHFIPTLLVHGDVDTIVSYLQGQMMSEKLEQNHIPHQFFLIRNGWHGGEGASPQVADSLAKTMLQWIEKYSN